MPRPLKWLTAIAAAAALKWLFDRVLWDPLNTLVSRLTPDFERAEQVTGVISFLLPLILAAIGYVVLFGRDETDDAVPVLRRHPWQSKRLIVAALIIAAALIGGLSYGRLFGLPWITLPKSPPGQ